MTGESPPLYTRLAAAYVRGKLACHGVAAAAPELFGPPLDVLEHQGGSQRRGDRAL